MINPNMPNEVAAAYEELLAEYSALYQKKVAELEAENANLHEQINTLDAKVAEAIEWQGQAMVRAEQAEDLLEKAELECARLRDEIGNALASMANCPRCWARRTAGHSENCASAKCSTCTSLGYDAWQEMEWCGIRHKFTPSDCSKDCPQHPG